MRPDTQTRRMIGASVSFPQPRRCRNSNLRACKSSPAVFCWHRSSAPPRSSHCPWMTGAALGRPPDPRRRWPPPVWWWRCRWSLGAAARSCSSSRSPGAPSVHHPRTRRCHPRGSRGCPKTLPPATCTRRRISACPKCRASGSAAATTPRRGHSLYGSAVRRRSPSRSSRPASAPGVWPVRSRSSSASTRAWRRPRPSLPSR
mmetsp:Transcript_58058/g.189003  ORF Transcript_58058/g.189003 Transcript_58058/m.189003 type:complete len:202 (+) Transcript_58058:1171-1776(+)